MTQTERTCPRCGLAFVSDRLDGICPSCLLNTTLDLPDRNDEPAFWEDDPRPANNGRGFSHFEIIEELGRGGMGTVYRARDHVTGRTIALKVLQAQHLNKPDLLRRFHAEVRAVTSLDHRHILPIHEVGEHNGIPFFSMKLATGGSLAEHLGDYLGQPRKAAQLLAKIARGVQHAHQHGILHRDLKPGNILLDDAGEPYVCDFGLAKWIDDDRRFTITAAVLGTPHYIAPEQAIGKDALTIAADIYSLGAILYELLTGRPPFVGETVIDTLRQASENTPAKPSSIVNHTPRDLETVCLKALEREPLARYRTAGAFAEDLENWLAGRPIHARPVGAAEQLWRWARRNPLPATLGSVLFLALVALAVGSTLAAVKINKSLQRAVAAEHESIEQLYTALLAQARASRMTEQAGHRIEALEAIKKAAAIHPSLELRNEAIAALTLVDLHVAKKIKVRDDANQRLAVDSKLETVAVATHNGDINLIALKDGGIQKTITGVGKSILSLVHGGTRYLAARCDDDTTYLWRIADGQLLGHIVGNPIPVRPLWRASDCVISEDEKNIVLGFPDGKVIVYKIETQTPVASIELSAKLACAAFTVTGETLALNTLGSSTVTIWNYRTGVARELTLPARVSCLAWGRDGQTLAVGCGDNTICVLDAVSWKTQVTLTGHRDTVTQVLFNHGNDLLVSTGRDGTIRLWHLATASQEVVRAGCGIEQILQFSENDRMIAMTANFGDTLELTEVVGRERICTVFPAALHNDRATLVSSLDYSPDGRLLGTASFNVINFWDAKLRRHVGSLPVEPAAETNLRFLSDGQSLIIASRKNAFALYRYELIGGELQLEKKHTFAELSSYILGSHSANNANLLCLTSGEQATGLLVDSTDLTIQQHFPQQRNIWDMAVSPDSRWVATNTSEFSGGSAGVFSLVDPLKVIALPSGSRGTITFSPTGRWLAGAGLYGCFLWEVGNWGKSLSLPEQATGRVTFSSDERILAAPTEEQVLLVSLPTREIMGVLQYRSESVLSPRVRFNPTNTQLAVQAADNTLFLWEVAKLHTELQALGLAWTL